MSHASLTVVIVVLVRLRLDVECDGGVAQKVVDAQGLALDALRLLA